MSLLNIDSLSATVDAVNEHLFFGKSIKENDKVEIIAWISSRQGIRGSYCDMFAPTDSDFLEGIKLFTGERMTSKGGSAHVLGEETSRALRLLGAKDKTSKEALGKADQGMRKKLKEHEDNIGKTCGLYCCGTCTAAYWRNITSGGLGKSVDRLSSGLKELKTLRIGNGKYKRFPFYYTMLALYDIDLREAIEEMRYGAFSLERLLKKTPVNKYDLRRHELAKRILARI